MCRYRAVCQLFFQSEYGIDHSTKGTATSDIVVTVSLSTNHSFEWVDLNGDGLWSPTQGENVVDMGIRGLIPIISIDQTCSNLFKRIYPKSLSYCPLVYFEASFSGHFVIYDRLRV